MNTAWKWNPANEARAKKRFGIKSYRPGQRELITSVMEGRDALGILPTGGGKSLCYQLPALFLSKPVLVVSPLISLMQDQHEKLAENEIPAVKLNSTLNAGEQRDSREDIENGSAELVYVTPERLENSEYLELLRQSGVSLFVVDEAHCISQWGHDFRPAYLNLRNAIEALAHPPVLALTATATPEVAADILKQLKIPQAEVVDLGNRRKNLFFEVVRTVNEELKITTLRRFLHRGPGSGIIYVPTVRQANDLWRQLQAEGFHVGHYHAKMTTAEREETQQAFMADRVPVIIATKAFGLGIDKSDIRFVLHYAVPDSLESYVQEAGRAGRDGKPAQAVLFYRLEDRRIQSYFAGGKYPRREESMQIYHLLKEWSKEAATAEPMTEETLVESSGLNAKRVKVIVALLDAMGLVEKKKRELKLIRTFAGDEELGAFLDEYEERHNDDRKRLEAMMLYGQTTSCRARYIADYFREPMNGDCGHCDNCRSRPREPEDLQPSVEAEERVKPLDDAIVESGA
jgi:ATP-dependent DNA helicase RecQ